MRSVVQVCQVGQYPCEAEHHPCKYVDPEHSTVAIFGFV